MIGATVHTDFQQSGRVLVYDDDEILLNLLRLVLAREGYDIKATPCAQEGIRLISIQRFDLAIADLGLRRSNGHELIRKIRERSPETAIMAVSAYPSDEVVRFARTHTQAFLDKPFSLIEFVHQVGSLLEQGRESTETALGHSPAESGIDVTEVATWRG